MLLAVEDKGFNAFVDNATEVKLERVGRGNTLSYTTSLGQFKVVALRKSASVRAYVTLSGEEGKWYDLTNDI